MRNKLEKQLKSAFEAPVPAGKHQFLAKLDYPKARRIDFFKSQLGYIRKRVWVLSALLFIITFLGLYFYHVSTSFIWIISSALPFISLVSISEIVRSTSYNMEELEMSCKHNYLEVSLARMGILGAADFIVLISILLLFMEKTDLGFFRLGLYLITPFLLNCYGSLYIVNRLKNKETMYICGCITAFVSVLNALLSMQISELYTEKYWLVWAVSFVILAVLSGRKAAILIKNMEELQWNSSLTV
jgi:hypothetical protein